MNLWVLGSKTVVGMATGHGLKDMGGLSEGMERGKWGMEYTRSKHSGL